LAKLIEYATDEVVIIDFGSTFFVGSPPKQTVAVTEILAPEDLRARFPTPVTMRSDIWALASTIFEVRAAKILFSGNRPEDGIQEEGIFKFTLMDIIKHLGPANTDSNIFDKHYDADDYFVERILMIGFRENAFPGLPECDEEEEENIYHINRRKQLRKIIRNWWITGPPKLRGDLDRKSDKPSKPKKADQRPITVLEAAYMYHLLRQMLRFAPEKRLSAKEIVEHPWFYIDFEREEDLRAIEDSSGSSPELYCTLR
jgi:serine/threonine protein kinase